MPTSFNSSGLIKSKIVYSIGQSSGGGGGCCVTVPQAAIDDADGSNNTAKINSILAALRAAGIISISTTPWILLLGIWNDSGLWYDTELWID
jgi:hypothetical protein